MGERISIIVPVYNADKFLDKCIESICRQTYKNLEIILINDGSTDHSLEICEKYAARDERIVLQSQKNQGIVKARQAGVRIAAGNFIGWADADDWMESDYIENLLQLQRESGADIVAAAHFYDIGKDCTLIKNGLKPGIYDREQLAPVMLCTGRFFEYGINPHLYTKLFRASILKKTQLMVDSYIIAGDDAAVVYPSLLMAKSVCVSELSGYHYVQHPGSITKTGFPDEQGRIKALAAFLEKAFREAGVASQTSCQLIAYENYLLSLRKIEVFDVPGEDSILAPYGGLRAGERIVLYGAGALGQGIYAYLKRDGRTEIAGWLDRSYEAYREQGFPVDSPECLRDRGFVYDYILIASIMDRTAMSIRNFLLSQGVKEEKIKWFTGAFCGKE